MRGILKDSRIYQWQNLPICDHLRAEVGIPVAIENLNNVINLAESYFGQSQDCDNILAFRVVTGYVGASLMLDGKLVRGRNLAAGLIHHVPMNTSSVSCECGRRGCINTVSSGFGILAQYKDQMNVSFTPGDSFHNTEAITAIIKAAATGEHKARKILRQGGEWLGQYAAQLAEANCIRWLIRANCASRPGYWRPSVLLRLLCRLKPSSCNRRLTVRSLTGYPLSRRPSARRATHLQTIHDRLKRAGVGGVLSALTTCWLRDCVEQTETGTMLLGG